MMPRGSIWALLVCFQMRAVSSETSDELLLALKQKFVQQPDCTPLFEIRHPGYISSNATAHPAITTDAECRSSCIKDKSCMSYQIDLRPGQTFCRKQSSYSIEDLQGPFSAADVKEYVFTVKCTNNTNAGQCSPLIEIRLRNWNTYRAHKELSVKSEMECRAICVNDQGCMSYQIDVRPSGSVCFIQMNFDMFHKNLLYMADVVKEFFVVDRCLDRYDISYRTDCSSIFKKLHKGVSQMATPYPFITTENLCRHHCLFMPDCVSYQINRNPEAPFCLTQTKINNLMEDKLIKADLVTEYILVNPCTNKSFDKSAPDCKPFIFPNPYGTVSFYGEAHKEITSYNECQSLCLATPTCAAFQNTSNSVYCWIVNDWKTLMPDRAYYTEFVNEYVVARKCSKGPSNQPTTPGGPQKPVSNTTKLPPATLDKCSKHDVIFAICISGIIPGDLESEKRLAALKSFVSDAAAGLKVASKADQIALVTFEDVAYVEFYLNSYNDTTSLAAAIAKLGCHKCSAEETSAASALATIKTKILTETNGYRREASQLIIVVTDRWWTLDLEETDALASDLEDAGAFIVPVGVTDTLVDADLRRFATLTEKGKPQQLLWANDFASLNSLIPKLKNTIETIAC